MLQIFSRIVLALIVAVGFQMTAWAGKNMAIDRLSKHSVMNNTLQENVSIKELPAAVTAAIKNRFPKSELLWAEKDFDKGMVKYEVKVKNDGKIYEIEVTDKGKILKIELEH